MMKERERKTERKKEATTADVNARVNLKSWNPLNESSLAFNTSFIEGK